MQNMIPRTDQTSPDIATRPTKIINEKFIYIYIYIYIYISKERCILDTYLVKLAKNG